MSVQFGRWNFERHPIAPNYIRNVSASLAPYGPDSNESYSKDGLSILYRAFHTTKESRRENQPHISPSGAVIAWDGRLDNRTELIRELRHSLTINSTDVEIAAATFERWNDKCFAKLIGDWALSIWNPNNRSLILAKDPIGTRHLYYSIDKDHIAWSTVLDPLVLFAGKEFSICEEYIAGWLSYFPAAHLTPYVGIHAVPPSSFVLLQPGRKTISKYWDFDPSNKIRYRDDAEYEEHFRTAFAEAVQRRLRSDCPVLAELSGGMDSSSIVCMADVVIARGQTECPRLDTISWYDNSYDHIEPDTNEFHWITRVEQQRSRVGCHIDLCSLEKEASSQQSFECDFEFDNDHLAATPVPNRALSEHFKRYAEHMLSHGHRVTLSGIGGDEVTYGDVPTPTAELQDLLARAKFFRLAHQVKAWAAKMRKPQLPLLWKAFRGFFSPSLTGIPLEIRPAPWLQAGFVRRNYGALRGYPSRVKLIGPLPTFQENVVTLSVLRRLLAHCALLPEILREIRFPYLDRDFLEFMYAIPREQSVGIGKRRFLMKRALVDIVPKEVLSRRRKAFLREAKTVSRQWQRLIEPSQDMLSGSTGFVSPHRFYAALREARRIDGEPTLLLSRTLKLELWLRHLTNKAILKASTTTKSGDCSSSFEANKKFS